MRPTVVSTGAALSHCRRSIAALLLFTAPALGQRSAAPSEDGYDLWLRYRPVADASRLAEYRSAITGIVIEGDSPTLRAVRDELSAGLTGLLGRQIRIDGTEGAGGLVIAGTPGGSAVVRSLSLDADLAKLGDEGYLLRAVTVRGKRAIVIAAKADVGVLYGAFALLSRLQQSMPIARLDVASAPRIQLRLIDHWDNLDRSIEHGYGGLVALGVDGAAGLGVAALPRLRSGGGVDRHQRRVVDERQRQREGADDGVREEGHGDRRRVPPLRNSRVSHGALQRADRDRRSQDG